MASVFTPVSAVSGGKKNLKLKVRVAHIWNITDKEKPDEITCMNLLLIDEKADKIHATVRKSLVKSFRAKINEGSLYELEQIMIGFNEGPFKVTRHKHKITMMHNSRWTEIQDEPNVPLNSFDFESFESILTSTVEEKIVDVIGHIVEKDALRETEKNGRKSRVIDLTLEDLENRRVHCSLWGDYADKFIQYMDGHDPSTPAILIMQYCRQRKYMGVMGVSNSFFGTNLIINGNYPEFADYKSKMGNAEIRVTQGVSSISGHNTVPLSDDLLNTRRMSIEDLIEANEACLGSVLATICEVETGAEWYFRSCTKCASLVTINDGVLTCKRCATCKSAVLRFKVHVIVMDDTGSTTFVLFDKIVTQFIGRTVQDLIDANKENECPDDFNVLVDKQMLFKVEVSKGNVNYKWRNYGVKKATEDRDIINQFMTRHDIKMSTEVDAVDVIEHNSVRAPTETTNDTIECVDSNSNNELLNTPTEKSAFKRTCSSDDQVDEQDAESVAASSTKTRKLVSVKIEPIDK